MSDSARIKVLPIQVANKIAAGEVVDRPASVVKELIENALDAGATRIDVAITAGGRKLIEVRDNGCGMNAEDARLAIERHATSKIGDVDDIERIATLGFRGEALAATASVSRFRLETATRDDPVGCVLEISGGQILAIDEIGCPPGTCISVRDLFFNVPARRKFLRSQQTEIFHIRDTFIVQALAHPVVGMSLTIDGRETYRLPEQDDLAGRIRSLFGPDLLSQLTPVETSSGEPDVTGLISLPSVTRADRSEQYIFVNARPIAAAQLSYAIHQGYAGALAKGRHPSVFLFLRMPPQHVDVNVHPTKKEVRFRNPGQVRDAVIAAIRRAISGTDEPQQEPVASPDPGVPTAPPQTGELPAQPHEQQSLRIPDLPAPHEFRIPRLPHEPRQHIPALQPPPVEPDTPAPPAAEPAGSPWKSCRIVGQIGNRYVILETDEGMVTMDPRAAHERVLYDRLMNAVREGNVPTQPLLMPEMVELSRRDAQRIRKQLPLLRAMGLGVSEFGGDTFVVDALPACLGQTSPAHLLTTVVESLNEAGGRGDQDWWREHLARGACRAAVARNQTLSRREIEHLVTELTRCEMPYTSPAGRPTLIMTTLQELNRKFGRT